MRSDSAIFPDIKGRRLGGLLLEQLGSEGGRRRPVPPAARGLSVAGGRRRGRCARGHATLILRALARCFASVCSTARVRSPRARSSSCARGARRETSPRAAGRGGHLHGPGGARGGCQGAHDAVDVGVGGGGQTLAAF